jgi:hypothetical protein
MVSNLLEPVDHEGAPAQGAKPLLRIDLDSLKESQDRRFEWAKQPAHSGRSWYDGKAAVRQVGAASVKREQVTNLFWGTTMRNGDTKESIHHSVVVSGHYDRESRQFGTLLSSLSGRTKFDDLWEKATDPDSLGITEKWLRWGAAEPNQDGSDAVSRWIEKRLENIPSLRA